MATTALVPVQFNGTTLTTTTIDGVPYVAIKPICDALSVDWTGQFKRIKRHPVLSTCMVVTPMQISGDDQVRDVCMLPLDKLNGWLFGISAARVRDPARRELLIQYQRECFDVLARHFGAVQPSAPTPALVITQKPTESQVACAMGLGNAIAGHVQQSVAMAALRGGDDWKQKRWLVSFAPDLGNVTPPVVEELAPDAMVLSQSQATTLMANTFADTWNAISQTVALAKRSRVTTQAGKTTPTKGANHV